MVANPESITPDIQGKSRLESIAIDKIFTIIGQMDLFLKAPVATKCVDYWGTSLTRKQPTTRISIGP